MTLPKLVAFDLDGTFWVKHRHQALSLRPDIKRILHYLLDRDVKLAVASNHDDEQEVEDFFKSHTLTRYGRDRTLWGLFGHGAHIIVQSGSKQDHLDTLINLTDLSAHDMLLFDDLRKNRDVLKIGVCFYQVGEDGLDWDEFRSGLNKYKRWYDELDV